MSWNNGFRRKKFEQKQMILAKQYRAAGMTDEQIQQMYEFDLSVFNGERIYYIHTQSLEIDPVDDHDKSYDVSEYLLNCYPIDDYINYSNRYWWFEELERLYCVVKELSDDDKELITLYVFDGLTQKEIATILNCAQNTVSHRLSLIKKRFIRINSTLQSEKSHHCGGDRK